MRRKPSAEIAARVQTISHALTCAYCTADVRDKTHALALLFTGVELLEDLGFDRQTITDAFDLILAAVPRDPRADTSGT